VLATTSETRINAGRNTSEIGDKNRTKKSVQVILDISLNTLRICSGKHHVKAIETKKTQAFQSDSSTTTPTHLQQSTHNPENQSRETVASTSSRN
jgi:hypothetical protein